jgi:hypothetical protein
MFHSTRLLESSSYLNPLPVLFDGQKALETITLRVE